MEIKSNDESDNRCHLERKWEI